MVTVIRSQPINNKIESLFIKKIKKHPFCQKYMLNGFVFGFPLYHYFSLLLKYFGRVTVLHGDHNTCFNRSCYPFKVSTSGRCGGVQGLVQVLGLALPQKRSVCTRCQVLDCCRYLSDINLIAFLF